MNGCDSSAVNSAVCELCCSADFKIFMVYSTVQNNLLTCIRTEYVDPHDHVMSQRVSEVAYFCYSLPSLLSAIMYVIDIYIYSVIVRFAPNTKWLSFIFVLGILYLELLLSLPILHHRQQRY